MKRLLAAAAALLLVAGCDSPKASVDAARKQLAAFQAAPDAEKQAALESTLDKLDTQIAALRNKGDRAQAEAFRQQASDLRTEFQAAKMARALNDAKNAIKGIGESLKEAGKSFTETFKNAGTTNP